MHKKEKITFLDESFVMCTNFTPTKSAAWVTKEFNVELP